jgi:gliding motility-associated-like protein
MANGAFTANFNIAANGLQEIQIPHGIAHISNAESGLVIKKSIKIKVNPGQPAVVAYAQQWGASRSAATLLLPTNVLGKKYYAVSFTQTGSDQGTYIAKSQFQIIATKPNTVVRITPKSNGVLGTPFTVSLPLAGDMYQYQSGQDITGSYIESIASASGGCLPIAVFSGSSNVTFGSTTCTNNSNISYDPLFQQQYPVSTWGKNFGFVPFADYPNGSAYRVVASEDNTSVFFNGSQVATLMAGEFYPAGFSSTPVVLTQGTSITADKPICVAQYAPRMNCGGGGFGDPDMVMLNPIEQNIKDITIFSSSKESITRQWINVLLKTVSVPSFRINGTLPTGTWQAMPTLPGYSYLRQLLNGPGSYRLAADSGFNAIAYGFSSNFESYAFSAGTNVRDLYTQLGFATLYGNASSPSVCLGNPSTFKISLPYRADSMYWDFHGFQTPNVMVENYPNQIPFDSTTFSNGKQLWWYSLPGIYTYNTIGTFPVTVTTYSPNSDGCGSEQEIDFDIEVYPKPIADFNFTTDGCLSNPVLFTENSTTGGRPIYKRYWNFGDASTSVLTNPSHTYALSGSYNVKHAYINDIGCITDTASHIVTLNNPPVARFSVAAPTCVNSDITFTDQSSASAGGTLSQWTWDFGDGSPVVIRNSSTNEIHRYGAPGTYTATLRVVTASGCQSLLFSFPVTIHPNPVSNFTLPTACLPVGAAQFNDLSTITGTGNNITGWTWNFGDAGTSTVQNPLHNYTTAGPFNVSLKVTTNNGCTDTRTQQLTTVYAEPVAAFNSLPEVCIGSLIGFSDASTAPGTVVNGWTWDFGDGSPLSNLQNPTHTYATAGSYTVTLRVSTLAGCQTVNNVATRTVLVKPLPTATISGTSTVCLNAPSPFITFTGASGSAPFHFSFSVNGGPTQVAVANSGNTITVPAPTNTTGTFTYTLQSVQETATTGCAQSQTGTAVITVKPLPTATIAGSVNLCRNAPSPSITFTAANGTAPYKFEYNINGGPVQTATAPSGNSVSIPVPTGTAGTFTYNLVSIQEGSANLCSQAQTGSAVVVINELPTATIAGNTEVCLNAPSPNVTFTGAAGVAPYTFTYTINGGASQTINSTGSTVSIPVPTGTAGTFVYSLVDVKDASSTTCNQAQSGTATVTVNPLPTGNFNFTIPSCETRNITFTDASVANAGTLNNWQWNFGDAGSGNNTSALQSPAHTYATTGTYLVSLIATSDKGCVSPLFSRNVTINARPQAGFISPEVCMTDPNAPFIDTSKVAGGSIVGWEWNFGDPNANAGNPNVSFLQNPTHRFSVVGPYTTRLIATSNNGCKDTIQQTFTVNGSIPVAGFTVQNANALCSNTAVSLKDASTVDFGSLVKIEIYWDYLNNPADKTTDDNPVAGNTYTHTYPEFGTPFTKTYQVRYVAYSGINCVNTSTKTITVLATPTLQFTPIPFACSSQPAFQITQAQLLNGLPGTGVFSGNGGVSSTGQFNPAVGGGSYTIRYTFTGTNGCSNYKEQVLDIYNTPAVNAGPDKFVLEGGQVTLTPALNANVPVTYQWTPPTALDNATTSFPVASPTSDITYTLTVTSPQGCKASDAVFVKVLKAPTIPNIFSPNGDGVHDRWMIPYLESYPGCTIDVVNRYGQPVFHSVGYTTPWDGKINGKDAPVGTYYYVIDPKNGRSKMAGYVDIIR